MNKLLVLSLTGAWSNFSELEHNLLVKSIGFFSESHWIYCDGILSGCDLHYSFKKANPNFNKAEICKICLLGLGSDSNIPSSIKVKSLSSLINSYIETAGEKSTSCNYVSVANITKTSSTFIQSNKEYLNTINRYTNNIKLIAPPIARYIESNSITHILINHSHRTIQDGVIESLQSLVNKPKIISFSGTNDNSNSFSFFCDIHGLALPYNKQKPIFSHPIDLLENIIPEDLCMKYVSSQVCPRIGQLSAKDHSFFESQISPFKDNFNTHLSLINFIKGCKKVITIFLTTESENSATIYKNCQSFQASIHHVLEYIIPHFHEIGIIIKDHPNKYVSTLDKNVEISSGYDEINVYQDIEKYPNCVYLSSVNPISSEFLIEQSDIVIAHTSSLVTYAFILGKHTITSNYSYYRDLASLCYDIHIDNTELHPYMRLVNMLKMLLSQDKNANFNSNKKYLRGLRIILALDFIYPIINSFNIQGVSKYSPYFSILDIVSNSSSNDLCSIRDNVAKYILADSQSALTIDKLLCDKYMSSVSISKSCIEDHCHFLRYSLNTYQDVNSVNQLLTNDKVYSKGSVYTVRFPNTNLMVYFSSAYISNLKLLHSSNGYYCSFRLLDDKQLLSAPPALMSTIEALIYQIKITYNITDKSSDILNKIYTPLFNDLKIIHSDDSVKFSCIPCGIIVPITY